MEEQNIGIARRPVKLQRVTRITDPFNPKSEAARLGALGAYRSPRGRALIGTRRTIKTGVISQTSGLPIRAPMIMQFGKNERNLAAWRLRKQRQRSHLRQ